MVLFHRRDSCRNDCLHGLRFNWCGRENLTVGDLGCEYCRCEKTECCHFIGVHISSAFQIYQLSNYLTIQFKRAWAWPVRAASPICNTADICAIRDAKPDE